MGFLKRIFGRSRWESMADEDETPLRPVWDNPSHPSPAPPAPEPDSSPPPPTFQPGVTAPKVTHPPTRAPAARAVSAPEPVVDPGSPVRELAIDMVLPGDETVPEELRGCKVIEQTFADGSTKVIYRADDGFSLDEEHAQVLIEVHRVERASKVDHLPEVDRAWQPEPAPFSQPEPEPEPESAPAAGFVSEFAPGATAGPDPGGKLAAIGASAAADAEELIDVLGLGVDLPPILRGARFVRRGNDFHYVTVTGDLLSKHKAEEMMERWEGQMARAAMRQEPDLVIRERRAPPEPPPEPAPEPRARQEPAPTPSTKLPQYGTARRQARPAPLPSAVELPSFTRTTQPARPAAPSIDDLAELDDGFQQLARRVRDALSTTGRVVIPDNISSEKLTDACRAEVFRRRVGFRVEALLKRSLQAREALLEAWEETSDRALREVRRDIEAGMLVIGLVNPTSMLEFDLAEYVSLVRLRASERRMTIVAGEVGRRAYEQIYIDLKDLFERPGLGDELASVAREGEGPIETMERMLAARVREVLDTVVAELQGRHGVWLPKLSEALLKVYQPLLRELARMGREG